MAINSHGTGAEMEREPQGLGSLEGCGDGGTEVWGQLLSTTSSHHSPAAQSL